MALFKMPSYKIFLEKVINFIIYIYYKILIITLYKIFR